MTTPVAPKPAPGRAIVCPICLKPFTPPVAVRLTAAGAWVHASHSQKGQQNA